MTTQRNMIDCAIGSKAVKRLMLGDVQIWPSSYRATLTPVLGTGTIAATGGSVSLRWFYTVFRAGSDTPIVTVSVADVQNVSVTLSDSTHFHYSGSGSVGAITADTRGTNGFGSEGWVVPQSAPERSTTIRSAYYILSYDGKNVRAEYNAAAHSATQAANNVQTSGDPTYSDVALSIEDYTSQEGQAPAAGGSTGWSMSATKTQRYVFTTNDTYDYHSDGASDFSLTESVDWIDISENSITVYTRGTDPGDARSATLSLKVGSDTYGTATIYQQENQIVDNIKTYTGASMTNISSKWGSLANNTVPSAGGDSSSFSYTATRSYTSKNVYTSTAQADGPSGSEPAPFGEGGITVYTKPSWVTEVTSDTIKTSAQSIYGTTDRSGTITFRIYYTGSRYATATLNLTQKGTVVTYLLVCSSHPNGVSLPAYASTVDLTFNGITRYDNGTADNVTEGVYGQYDSGNDVVESGVNRITHGVGKVSSGNLGTTRFYEASTTYTYKWSSHTSATCQVVVTQSENKKESTQEGEWQWGAITYGTPVLEIKPNSYYATALLNDAASITVSKAQNTATLTATAGHEERTATPWSQSGTRVDTYIWTSGEPSTETFYDSRSGTDYDYPNYHTVDDTPTITLDPTTWLSLSGDTLTIAANVGDARSGVVYVTNGSNASDYATVNQKAGNITIAVSASELVFTKYGGTQTFTVTATSTGWTRALAYSTNYSPFAGGSVTPSSGNAGETTITVNIAQHASTIYGSDHRIGTITFTSDEDPDVTATVRVDQYPAVGDGN